MKNFDEALKYLLSQVKITLKTENLPITNALGKTLATDIIATINVPPHDNSMMDGYALHLNSLENNNIFNVSQKIVAGKTSNALQPNTIARIFTGAPIPQGANIVIMQEETEIIANEVKILATNITKGQNIRLSGEDITINDVILKKGHKLKPQDLGLITSIGIDDVQVYKPLTIATFTTGSELLEPGKPPQPGKIYNANRYILAGAIPQLGFKLIDLGVVKDTLNATIKAMQQAAKMADIVITTGGVSVGEEDHIKPAIEQLGELNMWKVQMKPGKPIAYGNIQGTPFIGLPGNPVSAFATFNLFAKPYLLKMQGQTNYTSSPIWLTASFTTTKINFRRDFARAKLINNAQETSVEIYKNQGSGVLSSTVWADGFVVIPENTIINKGDKVAFYPF